MCLGTQSLEDLGMLCQLCLLRSPGMVPHDMTPGYTGGVWKDRVN